MFLPSFRMSAELVTIWENNIITVNGYPETVNKESNISNVSYAENEFSDVSYLADISYGGNSVSSKAFSSVTPVTISKENKMSQIEGYKAYEGNEMTKISADSSFLFNDVITDISSFPGK